MDLDPDHPMYQMWMRYQGIDELIDLVRRRIFRAVEQAMAPKLGIDTLYTGQEIERMIDEILQRNVHYVGTITGIRLVSSQFVPPGVVIGLSQGKVVAIFKLDPGGLDASGLQEVQPPLEDHPDGDPSPGA